MDKLTALKADLLTLSPSKRFALAYSGGLDSRFLAFFSHENDFSPLLLICAGPQFSPVETRAAIESAEALSLPYELVELNYAHLADLGTAGKERCYLCKKNLMTTLLEAAKDLPLCDGTNASDNLVFRPGLKALKELGIFSPLARCGITKKEIHRFAQTLGMENPFQTARPCLLTRFPYGITPKQDTLSLIAEVEAFLSQKTFLTNKNFRLRFPLPHQPELHIETQLEKIDTDELETLKHTLHNNFGKRLQHLNIRIFDRISGFFDTPLPAAGTKTKGQ